MNNDDVYNLVKMAQKLSRPLSMEAVYALWSGVHEVCLEALRRCPDEAAALEKAKRLVEFSGFMVELHEQPPPTTLKRVADERI